MLTGDITGLRGVDLGVRDVAAQAGFYTDVWRLAVVADRAGSAYLRGSGAYCHILALHPRTEPSLLCINLAARNRAAVDRLHGQAAAAGATRIVPPAAVLEPGGGYGFSFADPEGRRVRVIADDARHPDAGLAPDRPERITHVVLNSARTDDSVAFWVRALGFEVSDRSMLTFIRCNDDHHNIAFHPAGAATLHHIAFEMDGIDSVMRGAGRMRDAGRPIEWGPGRHGPGNNVFAYFIGPDDFVIEYTAEVEKLGDNHRPRDPGNWVYPPGHSDLWGATPPPSARMKAAQEKIRFAEGPFPP